MSDVYAYVDASQLIAARSLDGLWGYTLYSSGPWVILPGQFRRESRGLIFSSRLALLEAAEELFTLSTTGEVLIGKALNYEPRGAA